MRKSKYTRDVLAPIVAASSSISEVLRALGLPGTGGNYRLIGARLRSEGVDTSHLKKATLAARCSALDFERVAAVVSSCRSVAQLATALGFPNEGRAHGELSRRVRELGVDISHFQGAGWSRGKTVASDPTVASNAARQTWPDERVFVENSPYVHSKGLRRRLVSLGVKFACAWCGLTEWRGRSLMLHIDHINGINNDNRVENLRFLCPNCHSQTPTYGNRARDSMCYTTVTPRAWRNW